MDHDNRQYEPRIENPDTRSQPNYEAPRRRDLPYKVPFLAGLLSGILPGLGQVYVGYLQIGITLGLIIAGCITVLSSGGGGGVEPLFGLTLAFTWLFGIIDAVRRAGAYNRYLDGFGSDAPPPELATPGWAGSRAGGVVLIVLGGLLTLNRLFDIDLEWLENVWPLGLVGLGVWLVWKSRQDKATGPDTADHDRMGH